MSLSGAFATLRRALLSPKGAISGFWLAFVLLGAILAPVLTPYDYDIQNLPMAFSPPSPQHWLGTDEVGRDLLTRILYGARISLSVASLSIAAAMAAGMLLGAAAGYFGGIFDRIITACVDLLWSFPEILVALILVAIIGPGITGSMVAIAVAYLAQFTRLTRAQVTVIRSETYIEASRSLGARASFILTQHLLPNSLAPVLVAGMLAVGDAIVLEATLGFFGLGAQPPTPSWGAMMSSGAALLLKAPWIILFPGLAIALTVVAINLFGDVLVRASDIKTNARGA